MCGVRPNRAAVRKLKTTLTLFDLPVVRWSGSAVLLAPFFGHHVCQERWCMYISSSPCSTPTPMYGAAADGDGDPGICI